MLEEIEKVIKEKEKYIDEKIKGLQADLREIKQWWKEGNKDAIFTKTILIIEKAIYIREEIGCIWTLERIKKGKQYFKDCYAEWKE